MRLFGYLDGFDNDTMTIGALLELGMDHMNPYEPI